VISWLLFLVTCGFGCSFRGFGSGVADDLIDMADWFPTFCELAAVDLPKDVPLDGISFAGRLLEHKPHSRQWVTAGIGKKLSVFDGKSRVTTGDPVTEDNAALTGVGAIRKAQFEASEDPEIKDSVVLVRTAPFWDMEAHAIYTSKGSWQADIEAWQQFGNDRPCHC